MRSGGLSGCLRASSVFDHATYPVLSAIVASNNRSVGTACPLIRIMILALSLNPDARRAIVDSGSVDQSNT